MEEHSAESSGCSVDVKVPTNKKLCASAAVWSFWKRYYLSNAEGRSLLQKSSVGSSQSLRSVTESYHSLSLYGPSFCRSNCKNRNRWERFLFQACYSPVFGSTSFEVRDSPLGGLGLFTTKTVKVLPNETLDDKLGTWGALGTISETDFKALKKKNHPSLYDSRRFNGILFGINSLINHSCSSELFFLVDAKRQWKFSTTFGEGPLDVSLVYSPVDESPLLLPQGTEVLVNYSGTVQPRTTKFLVLDGDIQLGCGCAVCADLPLPPKKDDADM